MFDYLYYKFYQASLKSSLKDIPHIASACWFSCLLSLNILLINALLAKTISMYWFFKNYKTVGWFAFTLIVLVFLYFNKKRRSIIIEKYLMETNRQKVKGNIAVVIYIVLSLILTFVVPFFHPGKF